MVNSAGIYFTLGETVYLLCDEKWGVTPIGVSLESFPAVVQKLRLAPGQPVEMGDTLRFPGGEIRLERWTVAEENCIPDPEKCRKAAETLASCGKSAGLSPLCRPLLLGQAAEGNLFCRQAEEPLTRLLDALTAGKTGPIPAAVSALLGLGVGLTPSGDDVLTGLLYGLRRAGLGDAPVVQCLREAVAALAPERTSRVSAAYLLAIAGGAPFGRLEDAWRGLDRGFPGKERALLEIGSNSGSEMLLGLLLAAKCAAEMEKAGFSEV